MSKTDLAARPIYHHTRESTEAAHLSIVFAALAVSRWIDNTTGWSTTRFVTTTRRYRTIEIQASHHAITAADPLPDDLQAVLNAIHGAHSYAGSSAGRDQSALVRQHHGLARSRSCNLARIRPTWVFTVASAMCTRAAISALDKPWATNSSTSRSRSESWASRGSSAGPGPSWPANWSSGRRVIDGATTESPSATTRIAASSSSGGTFFNRKPLALPDQHLALTQLADDLLRRVPPPGTHRDDSSQPHHGASGSHNR